MEPSTASPPPRQQHVLIVAHGGQGHITPAIALARRISRIAGARISVSTSVAAHRRMFSSQEDASDSTGINYSPYSDGFDAGFTWFADDIAAFAKSFHTVAPATLAAFVDRAAASGHPVTCVLYTIMLSWAAGVAGDRGIPCALYWVQPATVLATYYHYFHGYAGDIDAHAGEPEYVVFMPRLPPMRIRDLPSFVLSSGGADKTNAFILETIRGTLDSVELGVRTSAGDKPALLVNTAGALEPGAIASLPEHWNVVAVGPMIEESVGGIYREDEKNYMEWLDTKPAMSVVYISFGSMSAFSKRQLEEIGKGLAGGGRPFLWVIRRNNEGWSGDAGAGDGMVVEWCDQVKVLRHGAVGCFVTHCGWNSTLESLAAGVPLVAVPQWTDQETNAKLAVEEWKCGVRAKVDGDGVLCADELRRCVDEVMAGDGGARRRVTELKGMLRSAAGESDRSLRAFLAALPAEGRKY